MNSSTTTPRRLRFGRWWVAGALIVSLAAASACSSNETPPNTSSTTPVVGGTITIGSPNDPAGLDPTVMTAANDEIAWRLLYDPLVSVPEFGKPPEPVLAESLTPSADLTTWTLKLREGITFSDGTPVDAEAVKANLDRHRAPDSTSALKSNLANIADVTVIDPTTVEITLSKPWANLAYALGFPIASPTAVETYGADFTRNPVGSGPYTLSEWVNGDHLTFTKREDYWGGATGGKCCYADTVIIRIIPDANSRQQALARGEIDINIAPRAEDFRAAQEEGSGLKAALAPDGGAPGLVVPFNLTDPVVADKRVREAMAFSIDREAMTQFDKGLTRPNPGPFAGTAWDNQIVYPGLDLDRARAAADAYKAEHGDSLNLQLRYPTGFEQPAQALQAMWKEVGIETELVGADFNTHITALVGGDYQAILMPSGFISPHPDFILSIFLASTGFLKFNHIDDPEIDAALEAARTTTDVAKQREAYKVIDEKFANDYIWIWINTGFQGMTYRACLGGQATQGNRLTNTGVPNLSLEIWTSC